MIVRGVSFAVGPTATRSAAGSNDGVTLQGSGLDAADGGTVRIATVTVEGIADGTARRRSRRRSSRTVGERGIDYRVSDAQGTTVTVASGPTPTDPRCGTEAPGRRRTVRGLNGDGRVDVTAVSDRLRRT